MKELERTFCVAQSTVAGIISRLEQKGFIEAFGDASDKRIKVVHITPAGEVCCREAAGYMAEAEQMLLHAAAYDYGVSFAHILLCTSFLFGVFYVLTNALQARGAATESLIVNISRQGLIYIPSRMSCLCCWLLGCISACRVKGTMKFKRVWDYPKSHNSRLSRRLE